MKGLSMSDSQANMTDIIRRTPCLPTELTDLIIDHLACNLQDDIVRLNRQHVLAPLIACSSVCRSFHHRTSLHIFSTIILRADHDHQVCNKTISGLLDLLDNNNNSFQLGTIVHTLKLYTAPTRFPAKYAWGEVNDDFPPILRNVFLPSVLRKLTCIRSLHLLHRYPEPFRYSDLSESLKVGIEGILCGPSLSRLEFAGFSELPHSFLACYSQYLTELQYNEHPWPYGSASQRRVVSNVPRTGDHGIESLHHSLPFDLQSACFTGYNDYIEALIVGQWVMFLLV